MTSPADVIRVLGLEPLPGEGGYYRETYRSSADVEPGAPFNGSRSMSTAIYYFLSHDTFSAMHRLPGDEIFHFYMGDPVEMLELFPNGHGRITILGTDLRTMQPQHVVPGGTWQGSRLIDGGAWALLGTTMSPGFSFDDYEAGGAGLKEVYPEFAHMIETRLTHEASE